MILVWFGSGKHSLLCPKWVYAADQGMDFG